jgi:uncharacterized protein (DUF1015 family)
MIENNSVSLLMSEEILEKTNDYNVIKMAKNKIQLENDDIRTSREILENKNKRIRE